MCFSLDFLKSILILCVVIGAIILILKIIVPYAITKMGIALGDGWNVVLAVFRIFIGALIAIFVLLIVFEMIACLLSFVNIESLHFR